MSKNTNRFLPILLVLALLAMMVSPALVGAQAMENGLDVEDGAVVSGTVDITGYADDPNFSKWDLFVLPGGDDSAKIWLATGTDAGEFSVSVDTTNFPDGDHVLSLRVVRSDSNYDTYNVDFTVDNSGGAMAEEGAAMEEAAMAEEEAAMAEEGAMAEEAAPAEETTMVEENAMVAPENGITAPEDGATVSGTVDVMGYATAPDFSKWQLDVLPGEDAGSAIFVALGTDAGEFTYSLDTTAFPDGTHGLRLRVVHADSNYDEYTTTFTIANAGEEAAMAEEAAMEEAAPAEETAMAEEGAAMEETAPAEEPAMAEEGMMAGEATNGFDAEDGVTLNGTVDITGYADDPNFVRWDLFVLPGGDDSAKIWVASGDEAGEFSVSLDTTNFPDGDHVLSLRIVKAPTYNYDEYQLNFTLDNAEAAS